MKNQKKQRKLLKKLGTTNDFHPTKIMEREITYYGPLLDQTIE